MQLEFEAPLPQAGDLPARAGVFEVGRIEVDRMFLVKLLRKLASASLINGAEQEQIDDWLLLTSRGIRMAANRRSAAFRFRYLEAPPDRRETPFSISDDRLEELARSFVREAGLVAERDELPLNRINHLREQVQEVGQPPGEARVLDAGVVLGRTIGPLPVLGVGGYTEVRIGPDERVLGGRQIRRPLGRRLETAEILSPGSAVARLRRRLQERELTGRISVVRADLCYFEKGAAAEQRYFEPTYAFVFRTRTQEFPYKSAEVIPAVAQPLEDWEGLRDRP